jgi:hypothetical protein
VRSRCLQGWALFWPEWRLIVYKFDNDGLSSSNVGRKTPGDSLRGASFSRMATQSRRSMRCSLGRGFPPLEDGELLAKSSGLQCESMARHRPDKLCPR